jgi:hypothetical protein
MHTLGLMQVLYDPQYNPLWFGLFSNINFCLFVCSSSPSSILKNFSLQQSFPAMIRKESEITSDIVSFYHEVLINEKTIHAPDDLTKITASNRFLLSFKPFPRQFSASTLCRKIVSLFLIGVLDCLLSLFPSTL